MNYDAKMSPRAVQMRKETQKFIESIEGPLIPHINATTWPDWVFPGIKKLGVNGLTVKDFGGPGLTTLEAGSIIYEMAKIDGSVAMSFLVHNCLGMAVINELCSEAQRARLMPQLLSLEKTISFGLTEPAGGSDASNPLTTAVKVEGGYRLTGQKRWIGNATFADYITVWAKNTSEGGLVQGFIVTKGSAGLRTDKMQLKMSCRMTQNTDIYMDNVFVPDDMRLVKAKDFKSGTNAILRTSRLQVAFWCAGLMAGSYEAALNYCLAREQFDRPLAKFQLI